MDITNFIVQGRDQALLYGDHSSYHAQLSKRLLNTRKKLGVATKHKAKFQKPQEITAQNISQDHGYVHLLLLTSERAWAHAMTMKNTHASDEKGITGRARSHIISRLHKATQTAEKLVTALADKAASGASTRDTLEAKAYVALLQGSKYFEKRTWDACVQNYSIARVLYNVLSTVGKGDVFKDLLSDTIDPSIRYASYQLKTPRTVPVQEIAQKSFPRADKSLVKDLHEIAPQALNINERGSDTVDQSGESAPKIITWRSREVKLEDAEIMEAWGRVLRAKSQLEENFAKSTDKETREAAAAYDDVLTATQDAVDATKQAIDELKAEGVDNSDSRIQSLQVTRTAVNFEMVSWRIGRNRVLTGPHDGAVENYKQTRRGEKFKKSEEEAEKRNQEPDLPTSRKLAKLKELAALHDGTLQNLRTMKELPGVAADQGIATRIEAFEKYFESLRCLSIARSHTLIGNVANALALINHSKTLCQAAESTLPKGSEPPSSQALNVEVSPSAISSLNKRLGGELQRHRAIAHIDNLTRKINEDAKSQVRQPLIERLHEYPAGGVDLKNLVTFPPKKELIPVNPIFLDVAWNYIDYPGHAKDPGVSTIGVNAKTEEAQKPAQPAKKGWFGFGRT